MGGYDLVTMRTRVALFRITLIGALAMVSAQHTYTTRNGKPTSDAQPGEPCIANACAPGSYCSINSETPICSEKCHNTKTRKGRQIPKRFKYFCNYGNEKPIKSNGYLDDRLPEPGFACDQTAMLVIPQGKEEACKGGAWDWLTHPRKEGCHVSEGCDVDSWCNIGVLNYRASPPGPVFYLFTTQLHCLRWSSASRSRRPLVFTADTDLFHSHCLHSLLSVHSLSRFRSHSSSVMRPLGHAFIH